MSETVWRSGIGGLLVFLVLYPASLYADEIRPALLQIDEREGGWIDVTWKIPVRQDRGLGLTPVLPDTLPSAVKAMVVCARSTTPRPAMSSANQGWS